MERFQTTVRRRPTSSLILFFRDFPLPRAWTRPNTPTARVPRVTVTVHTVAQACTCTHTKPAKTWTSLSRPHPDAVRSLSVWLTTAQTDLRRVQFRHVPPPRVWIFSHWSFMAVFYLVLLLIFLFFCLFPLFLWQSIYDHIPQARAWMAHTHVN